MSDSQIDSKSTPHIAVLLLNLGTPDAPTPKALRKYLRQFLSDPKVIEIPKLIWWVILNFIILVVRPKKSAKLYQKIWTQAGSPLMAISRRQQQKIQTVLDNACPQTYQVELSMRYGEPSIHNGLENIKKLAIQNILVFPLYPQYSGSSTGSTYTAINQELEKNRFIPNIQFLQYYYHLPEYINAIANQIKSAQPIEYLLISFHGIPQSYCDDGDPYFEQCQATVKLISQQLELKDDQWELCFQSRFGYKPWLQPYLDERLKSLPSEGKKNVHVICPGFSADCLETLEEIEQENRQYFLQAGGEKYTYLPALNDTDEHVSGLVSIIQKQTQCWL